MPIEKELLQHVINGDARAREDFVALFRPRLLRSCAYILGPGTLEAEEVVQETFQYTFPRLRYASEKHIYAWLRQTCLRLCYSRMNTNGKVPAGPGSGEEVKEHGKDAGPEEPAPSKDGDPEPR